MKSKNAFSLSVKILHFFDFDQENALKFSRPSDVLTAQHKKSGEIKKLDHVLVFEYCETFMSPGQ